MVWSKGGGPNYLGPNPLYYIYYILDVSFLFHNSFIEV